MTRQMQPTAARVPQIIGVGNHEYDHETGRDKDPSSAPGPEGFQPQWFMLKFGISFFNDIIKAITIEIVNQQFGVLNFYSSFQLYSCDVLLRLLPSTHSSSKYNKEKEK